MSDLASTLYKGLLQGDRRAVARLITMIENGDPSSLNVVKELHKHSGRARIIGLTGLPGSGKSTLACCIARKYRESQKTVGIIAVDPTSPFTGGALLGDRIRMQELSGDPGVFIRSMGSRGALGGLAAATNDVINVLDAFGMDVIMVETVGAGQVEVEIVKYAHTCVVVTMPGGGDEIQAIKAGILEIGDIFVVNKADKEGASRTAGDLEMMLEMKSGFDSAAWKQPVIQTVATGGRGINELFQALEDHWCFLCESGKLEEKNSERMKAELIQALNSKVSTAANTAIAEDQKCREVLAKLIKREIDPHSAADELARYLIKRGIPVNFTGMCDK